MVVEEKPKNEPIKEMCFSERNSGHKRHQPLSLSFDAMSQVGRDRITYINESQSNSDAISAEQTLSSVHQAQELLID